MPKKKSDSDKAAEARVIVRDLYRVYKRAALGRGVTRIDPKAEASFFGKFQRSVEFALGRNVKWKGKEERWVKFLVKLAGGMAWAQAKLRRTNTITRNNMFGGLHHVKQHCCPISVLGRWCNFIGPGTRKAGKVRRRSLKR
jgi:hypothetical protein